MGERLKIAVLGKKMEPRGWCRDCRKRTVHADVAAGL